MNQEFEAHKLTEEGLERSRGIALAFDELLEQLKQQCPPGRELSIARTKLEEACFFSKKAMAKNQAQKEPRANPAAWLISDTKA